MKEEYNGLTKKEIDDVLFGAGCDSYNRFDRFLDIYTDLEDNRFYALMNAYVSSDNLYEYRDEIKDIFSRFQGQTGNFLNNDDAEYFNQLPDQITIYRGMTVEEFEGGEYGVSWSLKKEVAEFFANTYGRNFSTVDSQKIVVERTINKKDVITFNNERKEFEVIYINN
ncbi:hypothetical protein [Sphingobacterium sp. 1.A.5]|uniref:hypothetical protein n=1 Tax=Sphingobacterium sp. 1.A.5 TaxID=2044604 RepID=UPI000C0BD13A|nr:hypothetical protein [Sphingobacterium sp. 1.A.5]